MRLRILLVVPLCGVLAWAAEADVAQGIRQLERGDLDGAVVTLDAAVQRLARQTGSRRALAEAQFHLAVAHLGLGRRSTAVTLLGESLRNDPELRGRAEGHSTEMADLVREATARRRTRGPSLKGPLLVVGVGAALGAGVASLGEGAPSPLSPPSTLAPAPSPQPTPPPARLDELSAAVTSPEAGRILNCRVPVIARVTLSNAARGGVTLHGVRRRSRIISGGCNPAADFVYRPRTPLVGGGETAVVFEAPLYGSGSGCCPKGLDCRGTCQIEEAFAVLAAAGNVPAGDFTYRIRFEGCVPCAAVAASAGMAACPVE